MTKTKVNNKNQKGGALFGKSSDVFAKNSGFGATKSSGFGSSGFSSIGNMRDKLSSARERVGDSISKTRNKISNFKASLFLGAGDHRHKSPPAN